MRKKFAIFQASLRRLLSLLLLQSFIALAFPYVDGRFTDINRFQYSETIASESTPFTEEYQLINRCSNKFVEMKFGRKNVSAKNYNRSCYSKLIFESASDNGEIRIQGYINRKYLCFSHRGLLIQKSNGDSNRCVFKEVTLGRYTQLQSVANDKWYVGFNKRGRRYKGHAYSRVPPKKRQCFMYERTYWKRRIRHGKHRRDRCKR